MRREAAQQRPSLDGLRVLIVEDDYILALDLERAVRDLGCEVLETFATASQAMDFLRQNRPDLVLLDVALYDGYASIVAVVLNEMRVPFVLVTGQDADVIEDDPALQAAPCLRKPFHEHELARIIDLHLTRIAAEAEHEEPEPSRAPAWLA